ncbi:MAG: dihydropteroate synthase [Promethearchaeota archaeon]
MHENEINLEIRGMGIGDKYPVRVMGVINLSRESFYPGSVVEPEKILNKAREMVDNGVDILDIGGRSTAPWSEPITVETEIKRVRKALVQLLPSIEENVLISIDTQYTGVAEECMKMFREHGMQDLFLLNDVSGLKTDPEMANWVVDNQVPVIIMATNKKPGDTIGIDNTINNLKGSIELLENLNYDVKNNVIIDPAIGRWVHKKLPVYDLQTIHDLKAFRQLGLPVLVAISRKSFIGAVLNRKNPEERFYGTLSATAIAIFNGAHVIRTHDVTASTIDVIKMATAIRNLKI